MGMLKKIWKDPVWSKVISVGVLTLLGWLGDKLSDGWVLSALKTVWRWIKLVMVYEVAIYWVIILIIVLIIVSFIMTNKSKPKPLFKYENYKKDKIGDYKYLWDYKFDSHEFKLKVNNIYLLCPECATQMTDKQDLTYVCPRCRNIVDALDTINKNDLLAIINDNIRKKYETK